MSNETTKIKKISGVKKNISIFKKDKTIKIKPTTIPQKKSMDDAIKANDVLLWGLNRIDSILLSPYEKNYSKIKTKYDEPIPDKHLSESDNDVKILNQTGIENSFKSGTLTNSIKKLTDTEYNPKHRYTFVDLDFLNLEYDRIEKEISQMTELTYKYDNLLDLQDSLTDLINELEYVSKNNIENNSNSHSNSDKEKEVLMEIEIKPKSIKSTKTNKTKPSKFKPYFWIGEIPEGYREATQEEAIINKKVSFYGKKKVQRELFRLFEITGTIYMECNDPIKLNQQIIALKGKLKFYKRELEFQNISLDSDTIDSETEALIKNKIAQTNNCYKKTIDILNIYIMKYNEIK
jgi:hypothetical protein